MLRLEGVDTDYGGVPMLRDIGLEVARGELVCLLGPNGAGKTTLFMTICGVLRPSKGSVHVLSRDVKDVGTENIAALGVGFVPEGRRLFPGLSVLENLRLGYDAVCPSGSDFSPNLQRMATLFPRVGERLHQAAGTLSGGEQAMVALARAMIGNPALVIMDEPSLGLSPKWIEEYFAIVQRINRDGITVLMIEQNAEMGLSIANRGYVLVKGRIQNEGSVQALRASRAVESLYF